MKTELPNIYEQAAGIDIGADKIFVCAKDGEYQVFRCFTEDFRKAAAYIKENGVSRVAMEATGVYWIALKDILEQEGLVVDVVKAGDAKQLPGRDKTDGADCQWIRTLYQKGLLRPCVIPDAAIRELRTYVRMRQDHIEMAAQHVQQMQKALIQMNIRLPQVLSDIMGASGKRIIEAIIKGERDPEKLVLLCDRQILKNKKEEVVLALEGNYREDYLFLLSQAYQGWQFYNELMKECDKKINEWLERHTKDKAPLEQVTPAKSIRHHKPDIEKLHEKVLLLNDGKDVTRIPGFTDYTVLRLIAEVGTDMSKWKSAKHFVSWLGLAPKKRYSGKGKRHYRGIANTKAAQILRESAQALLRSKHCALGSFGRRIRSTRGPAIAIKAMARKLGILFYNTLTKGIEYVEQGIKKYEEQVRQTELSKVTKWAGRLGYTLIPNQQINVVHQ